MYDQEIKQASQAFGVPVDVIQAVIDIESTWDPKAYRFESDVPYLSNDPVFKGQDASYGLMQMLYSTAKYELGYSGAPGNAESLSGMFNPATNINLGTNYLAKLYSRYGNWIDTVAAYNGGSAAVNNKKNGVYPNQWHVDKFLAAWDRYKKKILQ